MPSRLKDRGTGQVRLWEGDPDCDAMHAFVLEALNEVGCDFLTPTASLIQNQLGNLGEFVAMAIGVKKTFLDFGCQPANAHEPLNTISKAGIDLIWYYFGQTPDEDRVLLQEVKATADPSLAIRYALVEDHKKMFGHTSRQTLSMMLQVLKSRLVFEQKRKDLAKRITRMCGATPQTCDGVGLVPTIVHEGNGSDPETVLLAVRTSIADLGWPESLIEPWSVAISDIADRMNRLGHGT